MKNSAFTKGTKTYDAYRQLYSPDALNFIKTRIGLNAKTRLLDLACGTGLVLREFLGTAALTCGIDLSVPMLTVARDNYRDVVAGLAQGRAERLPFAARAFTAITVGQAIHWFDLPEFVAEVRRVLEPGGWLVVISKYPSPTEPIRPLYEYIRSTFCADSLRLTQATSLGDIAGIAAEGFGNRERVVFEQVIETPLDVYVSNTLHSPDLDALDVAARTEFARQFSAALRRYAVNGMLREQYFNYVLAYQCMKPA